MTDGCKLSETLIWNRVAAASSTFLAFLALDLSALFVFHLLYAILIRVLREFLNAVFEILCASRSKLTVVNPNAWIADRNDFSCVISEPYFVVVKSTRLTSLNRVWRTMCSLGILKRWARYRSWRNCIVSSIGYIVMCKLWIISSSDSYET